METKIVKNENGSVHVLGGPLTTAITNQEMPGLLLSDVDSRLVKVRPMATPIDQISRLAPSKKCDSMVVEYYTADSQPESTQVTSPIATVDNTDTQQVEVAELGIFSVSDTVMAIGVESAEDDVPAIFYVEDINPKLRLRALNCDGGFPEIERGTQLIRMGRAAAELDVQTAQAQVLPKKSQNFCQIFKVQVEHSVLQRLSAKEVGLTLSDQEEIALMDMRLGMEKNFLFGAKCRFDKGLGYGEVFCTQGIWSQAGMEYTYPKSGFTESGLIELMRQSFTGNAGSSRKILVGGSGLIKSLSELPFTKQLGATQTTTRWGIDFREIHTNFGKLFVVLSEVFDVCGHPDDGMVLDPEYIQKYVHMPFSATPLDLRASGQRNCDAVVLTEASCLVLRYPKAHVRIVCRE
ncbi:MAG: DUF5309 domain-containing protein [Muribaculum sp.]|nr:DUF5309 domain-containing protein [Muribaculum sp.]